MASLKFQISQMKIDAQKQYRREQHGKDGKVLKTADISTKTAQVYKNAAVRFGEFCKERYGCKTPEQCSEHIQDYVDYLMAERKTPSSIHTYVAGVCRYWKIPMESIRKPQRNVAEYTRSRGVKSSDCGFSSREEASPRLWDFASKVGIRRHEYQALRKNDLIEDESGHLCVRVKSGKGGRYQAQRVLPEDEEYVRTFFDGTDAYVFGAAEMANKLDLHHLRALQAQNAYAYYLEKAKDTKFREELIGEIKARWEAENNKKKWSSKLVVGEYFIRGKNREFALRHGLPLRYDRLALLATSVFYLAHWRVDVTVGSYLLAL